MMSITLRRTKPLQIVNIYAPTALPTLAHKKAFHDELEQYTKRKNGRHILITTGDFNARIGRCAGTHETHIIGQHTFQPETAN